MATDARRPVTGYLAMEHPFHVTADPAGGYVTKYPDLPGCLTQIDHVDEVGAMAAEIRELGIETSYEQGHDIPLPTAAAEYRSKFNLRIPRSLHRRLAEAAKRDGGRAAARDDHRLTTLALVQRQR